MILKDGAIVEVGGPVISTQKGIIHKLTTRTAHVKLDGFTQVFYFRPSEGVWAAKFGFWTQYILKCYS